jgi:hypothetical protein
MTMQVAVDTLFDNLTDEVKVKKLKSLNLTDDEVHSVMTGKRSLGFILANRLKNA